MGVCEHRAHGPVKGLVQQAAAHGSVRVGKSSPRAGAGAHAWCQMAPGGAREERILLESQVVACGGHTRHTCVSPDIWGEGNSEKNLISSDFSFGTPVRDGLDVSANFTDTFLPKF